MCATSKQHPLWSWQCLLTLQQRCVCTWLLVCPTKMISRLAEHFVQACNLKMAHCWVMCIARCAHESRLHATSKAVSRRAYNTRQLLRLASGADLSLLPRLIFLKVTDDLSGAPMHDTRSHTNLADSARTFSKYGASTEAPFSPWLKCLVTYRTIVHAMQSLGTWIYNCTHNQQ